MSQSLAGSSRASSSFLVVVSKDRDESVRALQLDQPLEDPLTVGSPIHVVPERHEQVVGLGLHEREECVKSS